MSNLYRFLMERGRASILHPRFLLRRTALMVLMMACMMPAMAQHPFTLTTASDITNGTQNYYLIQSIDRSTFYAIPQSDAEDSKVSTTSIPNANMRWYFMDAGSDSDHQYYYIVNSTGRCLYRQNDDYDGIRIKKTYAEVSALDPENATQLAELNTYQFYLEQTESDYYIHPKGEATKYLNKRGGNVPYGNGYYFKSSDYYDEPSKWSFVAVGSVTWSQPFTVSTDVVKHYYKFQNVTSTSFYLSNSGEWTTVSNTGSEENIWYFLEAGVDATYSNCHYYFIVNALTNKYLYYTEGTGNDVSKVMDYNSEEGDNYRFLIVDAAYKANNNYATGYTIVPKLRQASFSGKDSFAPIEMSNDSHMLLKNDRNSGNYDSHWVIVETDYVGVTVEAPTITNNYDGTISLSTTTPGATIYYTSNGDTPDNTSTEYSSAFSLGDATVIKAIAYLGSDYSNVSIYNVPTYTMPTISFDDSTSEVTITSEGTVYYNTGDGSQAAPTPSSGTLYSDPFPISSDITVKAIATHPGYLNSDVATWSIPQIHDYSQDYLTFDVITSGTILWKQVGSVSKTISYSKDDGTTWTEITATTEGGTAINVTAGDKVWLKGTNHSYAVDRVNYSGFDGGTATYNIQGNIMSLVYGENFSGQTALTGTYNFCSMFKHSKAVSAENLILPATSLTDCCYRAMFSNCTTLEVAPALPATTLGSYCYYYMFENCAITAAPELRASVLVSNCYANMFTGCTSLNYILCLAEDKSASGCLTNWVKNVSSTGTFVKVENVTWSTGVSGIPTNWAINDYLAAPEAPDITCDGEFITITCVTYGASIYYRLGQTGSYSLYSAPIAINENTVVEAYAVKNELQSTIVIENCIAIKSYKFAGMEITPGPLYYGSNGYEIKNGWNYDSYNSVYGKNVGSTYFNFIELGQLFESSVFSTSDGDIEKVLDPLDGWRIPTSAEWDSILGTTRSGSTVNGSSNMHYAMLQLTDVTHTNSSTPTGLLIFPDGETITGDALSNMDTTISNTGITESQLNNYMSQGCIFLPGSGYYDGNLQTWNNEHYYWSSTENNSSTGYALYFEPSNTISSDDNKDKETYYFPVYLVKDAADEATRLLKTWTYNNTEVELPYSVNAIDGHSASYAKGTFNFTTDVKVKESQPTYLWFQHADQSADIYVNNTKVETHWGGYNAFFTDITNYVAPGINNIRVALNNTTRNTLAPCAGDFNFNATLGEVKLISSPVVPDPDYGYDGFHITSTVTSASATITVKTSVPASATLTCSIQGTNCDYSNTQTGEGEITFTTTINNPHLWNGTLDPYLYDVTLTIAKDGVVYHKFKRGYGLRFFEYVIDEPNIVANENYTGFLLNGSPYLLRGVCMHHDLEGKANALTAADIDNDFEILKELGCNFVRLSHYPHPKEVYDHCDKMGIIVQTEVPWVNKAQSTLPSDYYTHLEGQYKDMVNQHYNHPCIMFWGLSNETTTDNKNFAKGKIEGYTSLIKSLDSTRWVGYVMSHSYDDPSGYYNDPSNVDWFGCNIYVGWYIDQNSNNPTTRLNTRLNKTLTRLGKPLAYSEYGCGGTQSCHSDNFLTTTTRGNNPRHDIEYQMWLHEGHIATIKNFPQLLFTSQWQLFDIAVSNRTEGYKVCLDGETVFDNNELKRLNNKGLVERDHKTKKDPFYLYKAWWNQTDKFVHICGKDYEKLTNRVIKCYTNDGSTLRLYVNDTLIETVSVTNNIATFTATDFNPGDVIRVNGATTDDTLTFTNYRIAVFTTEGNWNMVSNWSDNVVPTVGSNVVIAANATIPANYVAHVGDISINAGATLTIADGGQLYHNNEGVIATVQKNITGHGGDNNSGWNFIASPLVNNLTPATDNGFLANEYDLYFYDELAHYWRNYKQNDQYAGFAIEPLKGYLYANNANNTLQLQGTLRTATETVNIPLSYASTDGILMGFNLVGNPFAHNVTTFTGTNVAEECYQLNDLRNEVVVGSISAAHPLKPAEGFFVKATGNEASITFNSGAKRETTKPAIQLDLIQDGLTLDRLIMKQFGTPLEKLTLHENSTRIYATLDNQDMAVVDIDFVESSICSDREAIQYNEQPINFKAEKNGIYTLRAKVEGMELDYLHLIDNLTGANVDLLAEPSYTFEAKTTDDVSRFRLVFNVDDITTQNILVR